VGFADVYDDEFGLPPEPLVQRHDVN